MFHSLPFWQWVELSLSQVLAAWTIERHLEGSRLGVLKNTQKGCSEGCEMTKRSKLEALNQALPGLTALEEMMSIAIELPHPAIVRVQNKHILRATTLAYHTLELMEKAILGSIFNQKIIPMPFEGVDIIRCTDRAYLVNITRDYVARNIARVEMLGKKRTLIDKPSDNPEYICVFGLGKDDECKQSSPGINASHMFFKEIFVQRPTSSQETSAFSQVR